MVHRGRTFHLGASYELDDGTKRKIRELLVGLFNGLLWAFIVAVAAATWFDDWSLGGIIASALIINLLTAGLVGATLPMLLKKPWISSW